MQPARLPVRALFALFLVLIACGCRSKRYRLADDELARFMAAGPVVPEIDREALLKSLPSPGPYRVVAGDVLTIRAPQVFFEEAPGQATSGEASSEHYARVDARGLIQMPLAGEVEVAGGTLPSIERMIAKAVYPEFLTKRPSIVVMVEEYDTVPVSVVGAVENPGIHYLRSDQRSLFGALAEAGGILRPDISSGAAIRGARLIRIHPAHTRDDVQPILLPVKGLNMPVGDVALEGGERIEVERFEPATFTVIGLVQKPGAYELPPGVEYNLMQALATAGGVDMVANPPFATMFRRDHDGSIVPATFAIKGDGLVKASRLPIRPGDVIAVQHTPASWTRSLVAQVFRIQVGFFLDRRGI